MCIKKIKFKHFDLFGYPVHFRTSSRSGWQQDTTRDNNETEQRSWPGAVMTIILFILILGKLIQEIQHVALERWYFDTDLKMLPINFSDEEYAFDINDHMFLPSIDVRLMKEVFDGEYTPPPTKKKQKEAFGGKYYEENGWCSRPPGLPKQGVEMKPDKSATSLSACEKSCSSDSSCYGFFKGESCIKWAQPDVIGNNAKGSDGAEIICYIKKDSTEDGESTESVQDESQSRYQFTPRVNAQTLLDFITVKLKIRSVSDGSLSVFSTDFKPCTVNDFIKKGLKHWQFNENQIKQRICPDVKLMRQFGESSLRNTHFNETDHASFSIEIFQNENKSSSKVLSKLKQVYFTMYLVSEQIDLTPQIRMDHQRVPIMAQDRVNSQFALRTGQFRQTNTVLELNNVRVKDRQYHFLQLQNDFQFLKVAQSQTWVTDTSMIRYENSTIDGITYDDDKSVPLFREHFSLSNTMGMHTIETRGIWGAIGTLFTNLTWYSLQFMLYVYIIATFINKRLELGRYITKNRLIKLSPSQLEKQEEKKAERYRLDPIKSDKGLFHMKYRLRDIFFGCRKGCHHCCCPCKRPKELYEKITLSDKILEESRLSIQKDMNIEHILQSIAKLKAGMGALISGNEDMIEQAKRLYFQNIAIYADEEDEDRDEADNVFYQFLQENSLAADRLQECDVDQFFTGVFQDRPQPQQVFSEQEEPQEDDPNFEPQEAPPTDRAGGARSQVVKQQTPKLTAGQSQKDQAKTAKPKSGGRTPVAGGKRKPR